MGAYATAVLATSGIVSFYDLDETSGTSAVDGVGSNTGTYHGTFTLSQPGQSGQCASFNGTSGYVDFSVPTAAVANATIEAWFYCSDVTQSEQCILMNGKYGANGYGLFVSGNGTTDKKVYGLYGGIRWFSSGYVLQSNAWYHVALVVNGSGFPTIYVNGVQVYSDSTGAPNAPGTSSSIARDGGGVSAGFFNGRVDGAAFYNTALTATTILSHYNTAEAYYRGAKNFLPRPAGRLRPSSAVPLANGIVVSFPGGQQDGGSPINVMDGARGSPTNATGVGYNTVRYGRTALSSALGSSQPFIFTHPSINQNFCTVEAWFTFTGFQTTTPFISCLWSNANNVGGGLTLRLGDTTVPWDAVEVGGNTARLLPNVPHQLILVSGPGGRVLYVDGQLADTAAVVTSVTFTTSAILRDDQASGRTPAGSLDQFNLWNRPLSAAEVQQRWADPWGIYDGDPTSLPLLGLAAGAILGGLLLKRRRLAAGTA